jgi:Ca2+-binding RTX toxin-like protein
MRSRRSTATAVIVALSFVTASAGSLAAPGQANAAVKPCFNRTPTIVGTNGADELIGTSGSDVIVGMGGDDVIVGGGGNDYLCGNAGNDWIDGMGGSDQLNGGADHDVLFGAGSSDVVSGGSGNDILLGETGSDTVNGGGGFDYVAFVNSATPVVVDLRERFATGEGTDGVHYVEGIIGSAFDDTLLGNAYVNAFEGWTGADTIHGRSGSDWVEHDFASAGVVVDLEAGTTTGGDGPDALVSIENALGSPRGDKVYGDAGPNYLDGGAGGDTIDGRDGDDTCVGEILTSCEMGASSASLAGAPGGRPDRVELIGVRRLDGFTTR